MIERIEDQARQDVIDLVYRKSMEDCDGGSCSIAPILKSCVEQTVDKLWQDETLKNFVPLLAMKGVKDCIARGTCEPRTEFA
jgi:hypothetical protein